MKTLRWPVTAEQHAYMAQRAEENRARALFNPAENWMAAHLARAGLAFTRQAQWGCRIFDFWSPRLGCAIEVDGSTHDHTAAYDAYRDKYNYLRSGIVVLRVKNFDEQGAASAIERVRCMSPCDDRKRAMGIVGRDRRKLVRAAGYTKRKCAAEQFG